jgi:hypothetical protein
MQTAGWATHPFSQPAKPAIIGGILPYKKEAGYIFLP